jgi:hypothetical protein
MGVCYSGFDQLSSLSCLRSPNVHEVEDDIWKPLLAVPFERWRDSPRQKKLRFDWVHRLRTQELNVLHSKFLWKSLMSSFAFQSNILLLLT